MTLLRSLFLTLDKSRRRPRPVLVLYGTPSSYATMRRDVLRRGAVIVALAGAAFLLCLYPSPSPAVSHNTSNADADARDHSQLDRQEARRRSRRRRLASQTKSSSTEHNPKKRRRRILYIVTSLAEYNSGTRATVANSDRLQETTIPVVTEGIRSMVKGGYDVDLFLVCHYTLRPEREALVRAALPPNVGLEVWNEATPLGYITDKEPFTKLVNRTEHLARQHRFVIKDKVPYYDIFVNFEDDMLITAEHVRHFEAMTEEIARLRDEAPDDPPPNVRSSSDALNSYHGTMTKSQLKRTIPGFIRVEVLLDEEHYPAQSNTGPVPIDLEFGGGRREEVDAAVCCHVSSKTVSEHRPANPKSDQLMLWETHILPLGVRRMPDQSWLDWVVTQRGPNQNKLDKKEIIGDYWTNRKRKFYPKESRPASQEFKFINNQGGWVRLDFCYCCTVLTVPASHRFFSSPDGDPGANVPVAHGNLSGGLPPAVRGPALPLRRAGHAERGMVQRRDAALHRATRVQHAADHSARSEELLQVPHLPLGQQQAEAAHPRGAQGKVYQGQHSPGAAQHGPEAGAGKH
jgi:hypothetical protein